jgi:DNA-binding LacI/PurR family transcriptional regulator
VTHQAVEILRDGMISGRWVDTLPGRERLAKQLDISHQTIEEALRRCLQSLFRISPPTALIVGEDSILFAVRDHLANLGLIVPREISLICLDQNPKFSWCDPLIAHFVWDFTSINRRVVRWARNVALGRDDRRQTVTMARFVKGGTIGPVPTSHRSA